MSVYVHSLFEMSCAGSGLATGRSPVHEDQLPKGLLVISEVILNGNKPDSAMRQGRRIKNNY
jgi:hypothetical protein